jgi:hypothetical protein
LVSQKSIKYIDYIEEKRIQQNEECKLKNRNDLVQRIMITPVSIQNMVINKNYNVLAKIINIYLGNAINMRGYSKYILKDEMCLKVLKEMKINF